MKIATIGTIRNVMEQHRFSFKKSLGQNFLHDVHVLDRMLEAAHLQEGDQVLEIGPGIGALTERLVEQASQTIAVELDQRLIPILQKLLSSYSDRLQIIQGDILKIDLDEMYEKHFKEAKKVQVIANLPYYITTPVIMRFLESRLPFDSFIFMMQKEVALRILASPGKKDYGSLSIAVQYYCEPTLVTHVSKNSFMPIPKVDSSVVCLKRRKEKAVDVKDEATFFTLIRHCFSQRRKTLHNNLRACTKVLDVASFLENLGIDPKRRAETLNLEEWAKLSNSFLESSEAETISWVNLRKKFKN